MIPKIRCMLLGLGCLTEAGMPAEQIGAASSRHTFGTCHAMPCHAKQSQARPGDAAREALNPREKELS